MIRFEVIISESKGDYQIEVREKDGTEFAKVWSPAARGIHAALQMALPYMACAAEPDPFAGI